MNKTEKITFCGLTCAAAILLGFGVFASNDKKDLSTKATASTVSTNENGSISRDFTESTVTTNGNLVTERRRVTRTVMDAEGNVLGTTTSEYAQSYSVGDTGWHLPTAKLGQTESEKVADTSSFMGLKFGAELKDTNTVHEAGEPSLLRVAFKPKKPLAGFDTFYAYVTPKTHKIAKICACAKQCVEPGGSWRRHYLVEALEKKYGVWARLISFHRPYYAFDVAPGRMVTVCLAGASDEYQTVISAWDEKMVQLADEEEQQLRRERRKAAASRREKQVNDTLLSF